MDCFPNSLINQNLEFIAHAKANEYFTLSDCENEFDLKCKVLEWFSRGAYKTQIYQTDKSNNAYHKFMRDGINKFLGTDFSEKDMEVIYTYLGNCCSHERTINFIKSGYDMDILKQKPL
jgi:hypothetical protein